MCVCVCWTAFLIFYILLLFVLFKRNLYLFKFVFSLICLNFQLCSHFTAVVIWAHFAQYVLFFYVLMLCIVFNCYRCQHITLHNIGYVIVLIPIHCMTMLCPSFANFFQIFYEPTVWTVHVSYNCVKRNSFNFHYASYPKPFLFFFLSQINICSIYFKRWYSVEFFFSAFPCCNRRWK